MNGAVFLIFFLDFLYTTGVSIVTSWFFTSRYLVRRTSDHLGKGDVEIYRAMRDELRMLEMLDQQGMYVMPEQNRDRIRELVSRHDKTKELPA